MQPYNLVLVGKFEWETPLWFISTSTETVVDSFLLAVEYFHVWNIFLFEAGGISVRVSYLELASNRSFLFFRIDWTTNAYLASRFFPWVGFRDHLAEPSSNFACLLFLRSLYHFAHCFRSSALGQILRWMFMKRMLGLLWNKVIERNLTSAKANWSCCIKKYRIHLIVTNLLPIDCFITYLLQVP